MSEMKYKDVEISIVGILNAAQSIGELVDRELAPMTAFSVSIAAEDFRRWADHFNKARESLVKKFGLDQPIPEELPEDEKKAIREEREVLAEKATEMLKPVLEKKVVISITQLSLVNDLVDVEGKPMAIKPYILRSLWFLFVETFDRGDPGARAELPEEVFDFGDDSDE